MPVFMHDPRALPQGDRRYDYLETFFLRGLKRLRIEFTPPT